MLLLPLSPFMLPLYSMTLAAVIVAVEVVTQSHTLLAPVPPLRSLLLAPLAPIEPPISLKPSTICKAHRVAHTSPEMAPPASRLPKVYGLRLRVAGRFGFQA